MMSCARAGFPCQEQHGDAAGSAGWLGGVERSTWNLFALGCVPVLAVFLLGFYVPSFDCTCIYQPE